MKFKSKSVVAAGLGVFLAGSQILLGLQLLLFLGAASEIHQYWLNIYIYGDDGLVLLLWFMTFFPIPNHVLNSLVLGLLYGLGIRRLIAYRGTKERRIRFVFCWGLGALAVFGVIFFGIVHWMEPPIEAGHMFPGSTPESAYASLNWWQKGIVWPAVSMANYGFGAWGPILWALLLGLLPAIPFFLLIQMTAPKGGQQASPPSVPESQINVAE